MTPLLRRAIEHKSPRVSDLILPSAEVNRAYLRSVEWLNAAIVFLVTVIAFGTAAVLLFGPARLRTSATMQYIRDAGISWPAWAVVFVIYGLLLIRHETRVIGFGIGATFYLFYLAAYIWVTIHNAPPAHLANVCLSPLCSPVGTPGSVVGYDAGIFSILLHLSGGARALVSNDRRRVAKKEEQTRGQIVAAAVTQG